MHSRGQNCQGRRDYHLSNPCDHVRGYYLLRYDLSATRSPRLHHKKLSRMHQYGVRRIHKGGQGNIQNSIPNMPSHTQMFNQSWIPINQTCSSTHTGSCKTYHNKNRRTTGVIPAVVKQTTTTPTTLEPTRVNKDCVCKCEVNRCFECEEDCQSNCSDLCVEVG